MKLFSRPQSTVQAKGKEPTLLTIKKKQNLFTNMSNKISSFLWPTGKEIRKIKIL